MPQAASEQSWNATVPVSPASGSENVAASVGVVLLMRAPGETRAGRFGKAFAVGCVISAVPSLTDSVARRGGRERLAIFTV